MQYYYNNGYHNRYNNRYNNKIKHPFIIGIIFLIIFIITSLYTNFLNHKSEIEIGNNYEILDAVVLEKSISRAYPSMYEHYYIQARTSDGHEETFWVREAVYMSVNEGDVFPIYKYKDHYASTVSSVIEENAGIGLTIFTLIMLMSFAYTVIFIFIGIVQKIKQSHPYRRRRR